MPGAQRSSFGNLTFDATLSATHNATSDITDFPVEEGSNPSDHIQPKAQVMSLDIIFSPIPLGAADPDGRGEAPADVGGGYARQQYERLLALQGQALTLMMPWKTMTNMAIQSISNPVSSVVDGFKVKVDFKQLRFVTSSSVRFERNVPTKVPRKPTGKKDQGKKAPTPETPELSSTLVNLTDYGGITDKMQSYNPLK